MIGFEESEITSLFRIVAIILKLGNVSFKHRNNFDGTNGCSVSDGEGGSNNNNNNKYIHLDKISYNLIKKICINK